MTSMPEEGFIEGHPHSIAEENLALNAYANGPAGRCFALTAPVEQIGTLSKFLPSKSDAASEAALVVGGFRSGARSVIDACVRTNKSIQRFGDDPDLIDAFLAVLVDGNIISRSEARLGKASPKLSKFKTIGQSAEMLRDERVFRYLEPGYTLIYQVTVLYSVLDGDEARRFDQLVRELDALRPLSRERLIARTDEIKRAKKGVSALPSIADAEDRRTGSNVDTDVDATASHDHKLVLLTPDRQYDLWRVSEDYVADPKFLSLGNKLLAEDAVAVVIAKLADIPLIENRLLPILGFSYVSQVCLVRIPSHADVTSAEVLIIAHRKETEFTAKFTWIAASEELDAKTVAERLLPDAGKKLHLFASEETHGSSGEWLSIAGNANWGQSDE
jgi:hypothetical protein